MTHSDKKSLQIKRWRRGPQSPSRRQCCSDRERALWVRVLTWCQDRGSRRGIQPDGAGTHRTLYTGNHLSRLELQRIRSTSPTHFPTTKLYFKMLFLRIYVPYNIHSDQTWTFLCRRCRDRTARRQGHKFKVRGVRNSLFPKSHLSELAQPGGLPAYSRWRRARFTYFGLDEHKPRRVLNNRLLHMKQRSVPRSAFYQF